MELYFPATELHCNIKLLVKVKRSGIGMTDGEEPSLLVEATLIIDFYDERV